MRAMVVLELRAACSFVSVPFSASLEFSFVTPAIASRLAGLTTASIKSAQLWRHQKHALVVIRFIPASRNFWSTSYATTSKPLAAES